MSVFVAIAVLGVLVAAVMELIRRWHRSNCIHHRVEVERLLSIARSDEPH
jgi:hypothetical protein